MFDEMQLTELICLARSGSNDAWKALLARLEPAIRRVVRQMLSRNALQRVLGESDVLQSVYLALKDMVEDTQRCLQSWSELERILCACARNRVVDKARREFGRGAKGMPSGRARSVEWDEKHLARLAAKEPDPSQVISACESVARIQKEFTSDELALVTMRMVDQLSFAEIAKQTGRTEEGVRKTITRAFARVSAKLTNEDG